MVGGTNLVQAIEASQTNPGVLWTLGAIVAVAIWVFATQYWSKRKTLGPRDWPIVGGAIEQLVNFNRMHDWFLSYFDRGLSTFKVSHFGITYVYTVDPANVEYILKTNFSNFPKGEIFRDKMEVLLGEGIFNADGDMWRKQRKTASFEFASRILRDFSTVTFREYALKLAFILNRSISSKQPVDMQDLFMRLTLDSICKVGFGVEIGNLSPQLPEVPFSTAFDNANTAVTMRFYDPFWRLKRLLNIGWERILHDGVRIVDDFTYKVIRTRRAEIDASQSTNKEEKADLLSRFILLGEDAENGSTDKVLRDIILNFVIAGRDTTAVTLSWMIYRLTQHPEVADKLYEELQKFEEQKKRVSGQGSPAAGDSGNLDDQAFLKQVTEFAELLTYEELAKLNYLHATVTETLRLHPAVPQDPKGVLKDDVLPDGTPLKKDDLVIYVPYSMARTKSLWGPDAREFRPDRWLKSGVFQAASPYKFTSFQAGPRICLGKDSAYLQMKMVAAVLSRFFMFQMVPGHPVKYRMMAILSMAHGLNVTVTRR